MDGDLQHHVLYCTYVVMYVSLRPKLKGMAGIMIQWTITFI